MKLNVACASCVQQVEVDTKRPADVAEEFGFSEKDDAGTECATDAKKISTLGQLKDEICSICNISPTALKIIHRGRILAGEDSSLLSTFNFKENDKLIVLGKAPTTQTDAGWKQLIEFERKHVDKIFQTYNLNDVDLTELEKNFVNGKIRESMISGMDKRLNGFAEDCMKHLETLDGLQIITDTTDELQAQLNREKRKYLVNGIQDALNKNDKLIHRLDDYRYKCEHPEEGL